VLLAVVLALGAALAAHELGISPALGAFLAGMMLAESPFAVQVRSDIGALRTLFVTLFFASIGMLADVAWLTGHVPLVAGVVALLIVGKTIVTTGVVLLFRHRLTHAVATGLCLAQVGEFSFVIIDLARGGGLIDDEVFRVMVSATLVSLFATPFTVALAPLAGRAAQRWLGRADPVAGAENSDRARLKDHVILVGFGPAGQGVADLLARTRTPTVVIDLHPRNIALARDLGLIGQVGDGSSAEVLHYIGLSAARLVVITLPDRRAVINIVQRVQAIAPNVPIVARARYHAFVHEIELSGAHFVIDEEQQIGRRISLEVRRVLNRPPGAPLEPLASHEQNLWRTGD
jgi:CPA2 family monovalent cation:H+ antiporter-2